MARRKFHLLFLRTPHRLVSVRGGGSFEVTCNRMGVRKIIVIIDIINNFLGRIYL